MIARSLMDLHDRYQAKYQEGSYIVGIYKVPSTRLVLRI
jgi:hypothetical protein